MIFLPFVLRPTAVYPLIIGENAGKTEADATRAVAIAETAKETGVAGTAARGTETDARGRIAGATGTGETERGTRGGNAARKPSTTGCGRWQKDILRETGPGTGTSRPSFKNRRSRHRRCSTGRYIRLRCLMDLRLIWLSLMWTRDSEEGRLVHQVFKFLNSF